MVIYWLYFIFPAVLALAGVARMPNQHTNYQYLNFKALWWIFIFSFIILIGLRFEIGGDWDTYITIFLTSESIKSLSDISLSQDPGYQLINYISASIGYGIYGVNLICASFFSYGLALFCRNLPRPLLALAVSVPYLVIVVSMGYSRQAVAIGLAMIGLVYLGRGKRIKFSFYIFLAATMHKSAILLLPIAILASSRNRIFSFIWFGILVASFFLVFLADTISIIYSNYTNFEDPASQSDGAFIRLAMNIVPSLLFLLFYKRFSIPDEEKRLWKWFSIISVGLMILFFVTPASAAIDRVALYMIPLQLVVFSYLPDIFGNKNAIHRWIMILIIAYYALVQFIWLNFATHAHYWVPYKNVIFYG